MCSTVVVVQNSGGYTVQRRDIISTVEGYYQYSGGISSVQQRDTISTVVGYHEYSGGCSAQRWDDIPPLYCTTTAVLHNHPCTVHTLSGVIVTISFKVITVVRNLRNRKSKSKTKFQSLF